MTTYKLLPDDAPTPKAELPQKGTFRLLNDEFAFDPMRDMTATDRFLAGAGKSMTDILQGGGQLLGLANREQVAERRRLDQPLADTTAGKVGSVVGGLATAAPAMLAGGVSVPVAGLVGAGYGLLQPSTSTKETILNTALGGAGGALGQGAGNLLGKFVQGRTASNSASQASQAQKLATAQEGQALGYVVPPADLRSDFITNLVSGLAGKIKTSQQASAKNQEVTDRLAREAIGLKAGDELTPQVFQAVRDQAGAAYKSLRNVGEIIPDAQYAKALDKLVESNQGAARSFPGLKENGLADLVATMKQSKFDAGDAIDATIVLRQAADKAFRQGDNAMGRAQKAIATELEDAIERQLLQSGTSSMVKDFQEARKLIAKTYSVQKATNPQTGNVSAGRLAADMNKGRPLSDELAQIAAMGNAFPKATQMLKEAPGAVSPLDWAVAAGTAGSQGPMGLATLAARPAVRSLLLSGPAQRLAASGGAAPGSRLIANDELLKLMLGTGGVRGGLGVAELVQ